MLLTLNICSMKFSFLLAVLILLSQALRSQDVDWFQTDHEWYYTVDCFAAPDCGYVHYSVEVDTLLDGYTGAVIQVMSTDEGGEQSSGTEILRFTEDTVFRFSHVAERWHMLYDMGASPGDVWTIQDEEFLGYVDEGFPDSLFRVVVDSVGITELAGETRRTIYTSAWAEDGQISQFHFGYNGFILEGVGPVGDGKA